MALIARSASKEIDDTEAEDKPLLLCTQNNFNEAIEVAIKMLDRLDHYDRMFSQEE